LFPGPAYLSDIKKRREPPTDRSCNSKTSKINMINKVKSYNNLEVLNVTKDIEGNKINPFMNIIVIKN